MKLEVEMWVMWALSYSVISNFTSTELSKSDVNENIMAFSKYTLQMKIIQRKVEKKVLYLGGIHSVGIKGYV